jgi:hypothetical protein
LKGGVISKLTRGLLCLVGGGTSAITTATNRS